MLHSLLLTALLPALALNSTETITQPESLPVQEAHVIMKSADSRQQSHNLRTSHPAFALSPEEGAGNAGSGSFEAMNEVAHAGEMSCRPRGAAAHARPVGVTPSMSVNGETPCYSTPEDGELRKIYRTGECYYLFFGQVTYAPVDGLMGEIVVGSDKIWIKKPFAEGSAMTWIEGDLDADGTVRVQTPQCVATFNDNNTGNKIPMYLLNVTTEVITEPDGSQYATFVEDVDNSVIEYYWDGENLTLTKGQLGMCFWMPYIDEENEDEWIWYGEADMKQTLGLNPHKAMTPPAGLEFENYVLESNDFNLEKKDGSLVQVGFDGDDCWIKNLHPILTQFYVKGEKDGDGYVFPNQYLGPVDEVGYHAFFRPGFYAYPESTGIKSIGVSDTIRMAFDKESRVFATQDTCLWMVAAGNGKLSYFQLNEAPRMVPYLEKEVVSLSNPEIIDYMAPGDYGMPGSLTVYLPPFDGDGNWVSPEYLTFNIFINGELFVFDPDYYGEFDYPVEDLPYNIPFDYYDMWKSGTSIQVYLYVDEIESAGVRMNYDRDGKRISSDVVYSEAVGVEKIDVADREAVGEEYFNMCGMRVERPGNGIYVKRTHFSDGSAEQRKVFNME